MHSKSEHINRARQNERFAESINIDDVERRHWILVGLFLSALHYVQAILSYKGIFPSDHKNRKLKIQSDPDLKKISHEYLQLKMHNELARYNLKDYTPDDIRNIISPLFTTIKKHIEALSAAQEIPPG